MITRCDHCGSKFEVSEELVFSRDPGVRCGDCMALFDARANLFDENRVGKKVAAYRPVQHQEMVSTEPGILETADTMVSEHFYQAKGTGARAETALADGESHSYAGTHHQGDQSSSRPKYHSNGSPDIDLSESRLAGDYPDYRLNDAEATNLEFEQTKATESAIGMADLEAQYSGASSPVVVDKDLVERKILAAEEIKQLKQRKQKSFGERERRALAMDAPRPGYAAEKAPQVDDVKDRPTSARKQNVMLGGDAAALEFGFIPTDVLQKPRPSIYKEGGRNGDPEASGNGGIYTDILRDGSRGRNSAPVDRRGDDKVTDRRRQRQSPETRKGEFDLQDSDFHDRKFSRRHTDKHPDKHPDKGSVAAVQGAAKSHQQEAPAVRPESEHRTRGMESSAQAMRRHHQQRPAMAVTDHLKSPAAARAEKASVKSSGFGMRTGLLLCALIATVCYALYAARNVIANMNLPAPILSGFCQVTGCVPDEAKKDVSQLETMRKRLYPHPDIDNALVISVDLINHSLYKQPYPALAVTLTDAAGQPVAERRFESVDYEVVDRGESDYLFPEQPTRIKIEVVDTGLGATEVEIQYK